MAQNMIHSTPAHTAQQRADAWLASFEGALSSGDVDAAAKHFTPDGYWRDLVAMTWNLRTMEGREEIADMLNARLKDTQPSDFATIEEPVEADGFVNAWVSFKTKIGTCKAQMRLAADESGDGDLCYTLLTTLRELHGHEEAINARRPMGVEHGATKNRVTYGDRREIEAKELGYTKQPFVVIVGGGQGGIALGARMRQLGIPALVIDKYNRPGDQWRSRYKSLCLHDPVWYDHLPYLPFPANWPVFAPKDKVGDWLEMYTKVMEVPYWSRTECLSASYDEASKTWSVNVNRDGEKLTLKPEHLVIATGMSGKANIPKFPGMENFKGDQHHSSAHPGPDQYKGKKAVIVGANNSAHDIAGALWEAGVESVTMIQRSSTHIVKSETLMDLGLGDLYSERALAAGMTTEKADLTFASVPYAILGKFQKPIYDKIAERDADFYARLEKVGFMHDFGDDGSGLFMKYLRRASGYYIDVGSAELVADGKIKLAQGNIKEVKEHSVILESGKELDADLLVYATGYGSMNGWVADLISPEVADKVGKCWGLGSNTTKDPGPWEGEQRNMWKPTQQENLWFHGGNLHQSRHYSLYLALQLKARYEKIPTPVYKLQEVHHLK